VHKSPSSDVFEAVLLPSSQRSFRVVTGCPQQCSDLFNKRLDHGRFQCNCAQAPWHSLPAGARRDFAIERCFIYLDPDYAGADTARYPWLADEGKR